MRKRAESLAQLAPCRQEALSLRIADQHRPQHALAVAAGFFAVADAHLVSNARLRFVWITPMRGFAADSAQLASGVRRSRRPQCRHARGDTDEKARAKQRRCVRDPLVATHAPTRLRPRRGSDRSRRRSASTAFNAVTARSTPTFRARRSTTSGRPPRRIRPRQPQVALFRHARASVDPAGFRRTTAHHSDPHGQAEPQTAPRNRTNNIIILFCSTTHCTGENRPPQR